MSGTGSGVVNIYYTNGICTAYHTVTVNAGAAITGASTICAGLTTTLSATPAGGSWTSSSATVATVNASGVVGAVSAGTVNIYYNTGGCYAYHTMTVNAAASISGGSTVCTGAEITLTALPTGGTWSSGNTAAATVTTAGVVTGVGAGLTNIYYIAGGCYTYHTVTVNTSATISGASEVCAGSTLSLTGSPAGGTWATSSTAIATVSSAGVLSGLGAGVVNVYYNDGGCYAYHPVTVNAAAAISGYNTVCSGAEITLTGLPAGGTWSSGNTGVATVTTAGVVSGAGSGVVNIYYTNGACYAYHTVTVNAGAAISGAGSICTGSSVTLTASPAGGTWISSNTAIATVNSAGVVSAVGAGIVNIYYNDGGCYAYHTDTVHTSPVITGGSTLCAGNEITLTASPAGGTWSSGNTGVATVSTAGVVSGAGAGVTNIYYNNGGCYTYHTVTVNAAAAISGSSSVCTGATITLTATPAGGTWVTSNPSIGTVGSTGVVGGVSAGTINIYYNYGGCYAYHTVTVHATPVISGGSTVCTGAEITLSASPAGGSWSKRKYQRCHSDNSRSGNWRGRRHYEHLLRQRRLLCLSHSDCKCSHLHIRRECIVYR